MFSLNSIWTVATLLL